MLLQRVLFAAEPLRPRLDAHREVGSALLAELSDEQVLELNDEEWLESVREAVRHDVPTLDRSAIVIEDGGTSGDVIVVPFEGAAELFDARVGTGLIEEEPRSPRPRGHVGEGVVKLVVHPTPTDTAEGLIAEHVDRLDRWLARLRKEVDDVLVDVRSRAEKSLRDRREGLLQRRAFLASSPVPIKRRTDAPSTFSDVGIKRKPTPVPRRRRTASIPIATPRPVMESDLYEHIVRVIRAAGRGMTRAPRTYAGWGEEDRRHALLLMLNSHYEGAAHAEAFNGRGKTDILVRVDDVNVFVAECKFWTGPTSGGKTVDQLLGYATWHDTRLAVVFFVKARRFGAAVVAGRGAIEAHPCFSRWASSHPSEPNEMRCFLRMPGDEEREALMHVFFIHTPDPT